MKITTNKPALIVFEGIDGSGKTTLSNKLLNYFESLKFNVSWFREPSDMVWGKKIRELANKYDSIPIDEELKYFIEDRKMDLEVNIKPVLNDGGIVILDRYYYSNACYQGAKGLSVKEIIKKNLKFAIIPDITFIIDLPVSTALQRIKKNREETAILFEKKEYLEKVRNNYLSLKFPEIKIIDGEDTPDNVFARIIDYFTFE